MVNVIFITYKIDLSHNKHVYGLVKYGNKYQNFWGRLGFRLNFTDFRLQYSSDISNKYSQLRNSGYIEIDLETIERKWPDFRYELESGFLMGELAGA